LVLRKLLQVRPVGQCSCLGNSAVEACFGPVNYGFQSGFSVRLIQ
jgi:hypothetical protein